MSTSTVKVSRYRTVRRSSNQQALNQHQLQQHQQQQQQLPKNPQSSPRDPALSFPPSSDSLSPARETAPKFFESSYTPLRHPDYLDRHPPSPQPTNFPQNRALKPELSPPSPRNKFGLRAQASFPSHTRFGIESPTTSPPSMSKRSIFSLFRSSKPKETEGSRLESIDKHTGAVARNGFVEDRTINPNAARQPGGYILSQKDAPVGAANAYTRFVRVEYESKQTTIPIEPDTNARDLLLKSIPLFQLPNRVEDYFMIELFGSVGLQRPVRSFERIVTILNSWETDQTNSLVIVQGRAITPKHVAPTRPAGGEWSMKYSLRPGKWSKATVVLREDGQILQGKPKSGKFLKFGSSGGSGSSSEGWEKVCHLSDYDVYTPTPHAHKMKIDPPEKFCLAIKNERKSTLFVEKDGFVHFWCTEDTSAGERFLEATRNWRAWYRCWELGEGHPAKRVGSATTATSGSVKSQSRSRGNSTSVGNVNGFGLVMPQSSAPVGGLVASATSPWPDSSVGGPFPSASPRRMTSAASSSTGFRRNPNLPNGSSDPDAAFASGGLLGRQYSVRQREQKERERERELERDRAEAFGEGTLLGIQAQGGVSTSIQRSDGVSRTRSVRANHPNGHHHRTLGPSNSFSGHTSSHNGHHQPSNHTNGASGPANPFNITPLIDLTPAARIPPQHLRKGHGVAVDPNKVGPLVELATSNSPAPAIQIPELTDWRRARNQPAHGHGVQTSHPNGASGPEAGQRKGSGQSNGGGVGSGSGSIRRHESQRAGPVPTVTLLGTIAPVTSAPPNGLGRSRSTRQQQQSLPHRAISTTGGGGGATTGLVNFARTKSLKAGINPRAAGMSGRGIEDGVVDAFVPGGLVSGSRYR